MNQFKKGDLVAITRPSIGISRGTLGLLVSISESGIEHAVGQPSLLGHCWRILILCGAYHSIIGQERRYYEKDFERVSK